MLHRDFLNNTVPTSNHAPLGQLLLTSGNLTPELLAQAIARQSDVPATKIGRILVDLGIPEAVITEALALQAGVEWARLADRIIPSDVAHRIPADFARQHRLIPIEQRDGRLRIATVEAQDRTQIEIIARFLKTEVEPVLVPDADMEIALDRVYGRKAESSASALSSAPRQQVKHRDVPATSTGKNTSDTTEDLDAHDPLAVRVLDHLLSRAVRDGASDIHIEPFEKLLRARLRIDGLLHSVGTENVSPRAIVARCKILASLDPAEMRRPQDGKFHAEILDRPTDVRVSTVPTAFGEKVVLRLLDRDRGLLSLESLGMSGQTLVNFRQAVNRPHGIILVTGPTGSGKTTTLYAALSERNDEGLNITTIEDPIEYDLFGINQIQVHQKIDIDFAKGLRHVLRQDPDIILVGEIRDKETAGVAIQAALTGHLVLSTLHTNDAIGAVARLIDMGAEPFLVADALVSILSQRLVRRLCQKCRKQAIPTQDETFRFRLDPTARIFRPAGCPDCLGTGYRGRLSVCELLSITPNLQHLIRAGAPSGEILGAAIAEGHRPLMDDGIGKILEGISSLEELTRVT